MNRPDKGSRRPPSRKHPPRDRRREPQAASAAALKSVLPSLTDGEFIAFDIETTGGNPTKNGITEICALKVQKGEIVDRFHTLVNPQVSIPPIVRRMTGITNQMVRKAPKIDVVMPDFVKFIGKGVLVSHNTIGDMKFLRYFSEQTLGKEIDNFYLCTHLLVEKLASEVPNKSLKGLAEYFGIVPSGDLHRAGADAEVTLDLFKILVERLHAESIRIVKDAIRFQGDYESGIRLGWAVDQRDIEALPQSPGVFYLYDRRDNLVFFSSALNLRRDVRKLLRYTQLPRQMLRIVLNSYRLGYEAFETQYAAFLAECDEIVKSDVSFNPMNWHQRSVTAMYFQDDGSKIKAGVGPMVPGTCAAFGPVADRKEAKQVLQRLVAACNEGGQHEPGYRFMPEYLEPVAAFLSGRLEDYRSSLMKPSLWQSLFFGARTRRRLEACERLSKIRFQKKLHSLLDTSGLVVLYSEDGGSIVKIRAARAEGVVRYRGELRDYLARGNFARRIAKRYARVRMDLSPRSKPHIVAANGILWWVFSSSQKREGRFLRVDDLVENS